MAAAGLLPEGWPGEAAAKLFETYHDSLEAPAVQYVAEVCDQGDAHMEESDDA